MGMIRVSDEVESRLKGVADGRSMNATIDKLLAGGGGGDSSIKTIIGKLDYLENYIDKRLSKLESLIEDTTVDRLASSGRSSGGRREKKYIDFDIIRYIMYTLLDEDSPEWESKTTAKYIYDYLSDDLICYEQDDYIYTENAHGYSKFIKISPRVREALDEERRYE